MPYEYVTLQKATPSGKDLLYFTLVFHSKSKIIVKQQSPFHIKCDQCGQEYDNKYINSPIGSTMASLLGAGWKQHERGLAK